MHPDHVGPRPRHADEIAHPLEQPGLELGVVPLRGERPAQSRLRARRQYSDTVPSPTPQARAIARCGRRCSSFSRRISRTCLIDSLSVMSVGALLPEGPPYRRAATTDELSGSESAITIPGRGDHDAPEFAIRMKRNERSGWIGTGDHDRPEPSLSSASAFSTQKRMSMSRYITVALVRCSSACSRLPVR